MAIDESSPIDEDAAADQLWAMLDDFEWRIQNLYWIIVKDESDPDGEGLVVKFKPNRAQRRLLARLHSRNIILKARQLGFCVAPETRVLTADLRWVPIADLCPGDEVVAVDEHPPGGRGKARRMRTATVQAASRVQRMAYRITFDDGRQVVCTDRHPWLSKKAGDLAEWRSLSGQGNEVVGRLRVGTRVRWVTKPWADPTVEDGWFGGVLDGEGSMALPSRNGASINVSQRPGPVWDRLVRYADERGYSARVEDDGAERPSKFGKVPVPKLTFTRMDELFRLIGQTRPTRFIGRRWWEERELPGKRNGDVGWASIASIEPLAEQTMIDLQTSTGTYIAEGFVSHNTTLIAILWLDTALFSTSPMRLGIIAHEREAAEVIFRDKVVFAYNRLPDEIREACPLESKTKTEIVLGHNGSSIRVATSMRSGTMHRLHVSEFGKIAAKYPAKALEVVTGSIPSVPLNGGMLIVESTAEGQDGPFYDMTQRAMDLAQRGVTLSPRDYKLHFAAWWEDQNYALQHAESVVFTEADRMYFAKVESIIGRRLTREQRLWWRATCDSDFNGEVPMMWQEYPSYPAEAFQVSTEGCYFAAQIARARIENRIPLTLPIEAAPVFTFWDLGRGDMTAVWLMQKIGATHRFIWYYENSGEELDHYANWLFERKLVYGTHFLPHEADSKRLGKNVDTNQSLKQMLEELMPGHDFQVVPRVTNLQSGIQATRSAFRSSMFHGQNTLQGVRRLANYRKRWDKVRGRWMEEPEHNDDSHGSDAFRQFGQALEAGETFERVAYAAAGGSGARDRFRRRRANGSPMAA